MKKLISEIAWFFMRLFWANSFDNGVTQPSPPSILYKALYFLHYGRVLSHKGAAKEDKQQEPLTIEQQLKRHGYDDGPKFWSKGFVKALKTGDIWQVWHSRTGNKNTVKTNEADLFETLKYMERI